MHFQHARSSVPKSSSFSINVEWKMEACGEAVAEGFDRIQEAWFIYLDT
jgi:hypothetical protein